MFASGDRSYLPTQFRNSGANYRLARCLLWATYADYNFHHAHRCSAEPTFRNIDLIIIWRRRTTARQAPPYNYKHRYYVTTSLAQHYNYIRLFILSLRRSRAVNLARHDASQLMDHRARIWRLTVK